jgi:hypothetical protein
MGRVYINETNVCSGRLGLYRTPQPTLKNVKDRKERELLRTFCITKDIVALK